MAKRQMNGQMRRVAEGIYERNGKYLVPIYGTTPEGKRGKVWHGPGTSCVRLGCRHTPIVDYESAKTAKRELELEKKEARGGGRPAKLVRAWAGRREEGGEWLKLFPRKEETTNRHNEERVSSFVTWAEKKYGPKVTLQQITEEDAAEFAVEAPGRVREVRAMYNDAVRIKVVASNPFAALKMGVQRGRKDIRVLTVEELELLLATARAELGDYGSQYAAMLEVAAWTGVRPGELYLFSFERGDEDTHRVNFVDFARRRIDVQWAYKKGGVIGRPKYNSVREVVMLPQAERALRSLVDVSPEGRAFVTTRGSAFTARNQHYYWDPVRRAFARKLPAHHWLRVRMQEEAPNGDLDIYELRHFFGSKLAQPPAGVRPATAMEIAQQMGHKDKGQLAMEVYIHTDVEQAHADILDAWTNGAAANGASAAVGS